VIGAGQAGGPLAAALANAGRKTALIEREHAGGTCINEGCTPTKTMIASARVAYLARRGADFGVKTGEITIAQAKIRDRKRAIVDSFRSGSEKRVTQTRGLDYLRGEASFTGPNALHIQLNDGGKEEIASDLIVINAGARPAEAKLTGIEQVPHFNSTTIMELSETPEHVLVLGGGSIGVEFAQMFRRFGSRVTIVPRGPK
jgi:pyruvate/2-oxoglutarate dehydrogenase complex dihydrolipoamide dehydrogenase (E3) component